MGNCTGVFATCCGDDNGAVKVVDKEGIKKAMQANLEYQNQKLEYNENTQYGSPSGPPNQSSYEV